MRTCPTDSDSHGDSICFDSYLQTISEDPQVIMESPFVDVIKKIPSTWDETRVLEPSVIGSWPSLYARKTTNGSWGC
ncbi:unnamed protein product [Vitrella brassicaformis CCMP3155]|uniref:Uncharacterized protein n=1 Tax=Vitrella brassicaformis (strain CCMP3155) TaxID=1169540 RepID=A0A0G4G7A5_VITBC|nr:unnamed protein product [Vitrella brassicaformis CCMP3155]|eukprot:CEM24537.1 unnamed protein product [Vitrella brassicaformis CCMP3155]